MHGDLTMEKLILIKYGELSTKKGNRNFFINTLYNNIKCKLNSYDVSIKKDRAKMTIKFSDKDFDAIKSVVDKTFGIHSYHLAYVCKSDVDLIKDSVLKVVKSLDFKSFKVDTKRCDKSFLIHSQDFNRIIVGLLFKNFDDICVDVHNPDLLLKIEIREDDTYIYYDSYNGRGGYPLGTQAKGMLMLSGGIDSPVAGYLTMKRGVKFDAVYFEALPHTSLGAREKVINLCKKLSMFSDKINLHIVNFTPIQEEIYKNCKDEYVITIMRRMMYRIMDKLCCKYDCKIIVNGESIGQVASQTLSSMSVINNVTCVPVIRPLACMDKLEIIDIARDIDTYDTSIIPYEDCCTVFVPKHPVINPKLDVCIYEESKFDYESLINNAIDNLNTICIYSNDDSFNSIL